jgi:peptidoglycan/xylan/chitin deacetylase (PgdA/CDA1 family)
MSSAGTTLGTVAAVALAASGFSVATGAGEPARAFPWPNGAKAAVALTYDDGLDVHLDNVAPDLDSAGLKGTFYLPGHSESLGRRLPEWRALALRGHELGNHALFHPCLRNPPAGGDRSWVRPEYALEGYTVRRIVDEVAVMNTLLLALDGQSERTFAYNCTDTTAGGVSYVDAMRPLFLAARAGEDRVVTDVYGLDPMLVPSWAVEGASGEEMIAFVEKAVAAGGLAVFQFHGVGGAYIAVSRDAHRALVGWLAAHRDLVWTDTFRNVMAYVIATRRPTSLPPPPGEQETPSMRSLSKEVPP